MAVELLPDELWNEIEPLLPPPPPASPKGGRPPVDNRSALRGIIFVNRTGIPWQMLPSEVFGASGSSCWRRLRDWTRMGVWPELHRRLLDRLGKAGGIDLEHVDLEHVVVDSQSVRALKGACTPAPTLSIAPSPVANVTF
jgi:transposase